jgi:hypothetical protein
MPVERRDPAEETWSRRKEEPLGGNAHYGRMAERKRNAGESFPTETETGPKGQTGAGVPVLRTVRPDLSDRCTGSGDGARARQRRRRVTDRSVLGLIRMWLEAVVVEPGEGGTGGKRTRNEKGTPQGGVVSPLLANLFLHWFDALFHGPQGPTRWADARLARYAGDMVILAREWTGELTGWVESRLEGKFGLEINREKTRVVEVKPGGGSLDFLGYGRSYGL